MNEKLFVIILVIMATETWSQGVSGEFQRISGAFQEVSEAVQRISGNIMKSQAFQRGLRAIAGGFRGFYEAPEGLGGASGAVQRILEVIQWASGALQRFFCAFQ